jgi:hypothetical protein
VSAAVIVCGSAWISMVRQAVPPNFLTVQPVRSSVERLPTTGGGTGSRRSRGRGQRSTAATKARRALLDLQLAAGGLATLRLARPGAGLSRRDGPLLRLPGAHRQLLAVVDNLQRLAFRHDIPGLSMSHFDPQPPAAKGHVEGDPGQTLGKLRGEARRCPVRAHAAEAADQRDPRARSQAIWRPSRVSFWTSCRSMRAASPR